MSKNQQIYDRILPGAWKLLIILIIYKQLLPIMNISSLVISLNWIGHSPNLMNTMLKLCTLIVLTLLPSEQINDIKLDFLLSTTIFCSSINNLFKMKEVQIVYAQDAQRLRLNNNTNLHHCIPHEIIFKTLQLKL